jgi:hypothetical protein
MHNAYHRATTNLVGAVLHWDGVIPWTFDFLNRAIYLVGYISNKVGMMMMMMMIIIIILLSESIQPPSHLDLMT